MLPSEVTHVHTTKPPTEATATSQQQPQYSQQCPAAAAAAAAAVVVVACLGGQDDQQAAEDIDKVQEEVYGVPDVVITAAVELLHNELSVKQHKPTEEQQTKVQLKLGGTGRGV